MSWGNYLLLNNEKSESTQTKPNDFVLPTIDELEAEFAASSCANLLVQREDLDRKIDESKAKIVSYMKSKNEGVLRFEHDGKPCMFVLSEDGSDAFFCWR